jgi:hypothetical protein
MKKLNVVGRIQDYASTRALIPLALILLVACDPGMAVRQINSFVESENTAVTPIPKVSVNVKTTHQLIGERSYLPDVTLTNSSYFEVTITSIDLVARGETYENRPQDTKCYPLKVLAQSTAPLDVHFRFTDGIYKVFKNPGELRIHYSSQQGTGLARITVARGPLNAK